VFFVHHLPHNFDKEMRHAASIRRFIESLFGLSNDANGETTDEYGGRPQKDTKLMQLLNEIEKYPALHCCASITMSSVARRTSAAAINKRINDDMMSKFKRQIELALELRSTPRHLLIIWFKILDIQHHVWAKDCMLLTGSDSSRVQQRRIDKRAAVCYVVKKKSN
jgi:hypothetical protein